MPGGLVDAASAVIGGNAAQSAAKKQADAGERAAQLEAERYQQIRTDVEPYRETGQLSLGVLESLLYGTPLGETAAKDYLPTSGSLADVAAGKSPISKLFQTTPGYQFNLEEGRKAIEASAAARGGAVSGATLKDLARYQQGYASSEYDKFLNRIAGLAETGQQSAVQVGSQGLASAATASEAIQAAGAARAAGKIGTANAATGFLQSGQQKIGQLLSGGFMG